MFDSRKEKDVAVTLCIFPHLREFIAVDARKNLPGRPAVSLLKFEDVHGQDFVSRVESDFSKLLRRPDQTILGLMGLPQEVEALVRAHSLRRVMEVLNKDVPNPDEAGVGSVGVMFFAGNLLTVGDEQLLEIVKDIFGEHFTPGQVRQLHGQVSELLRQEREAVDAASKSELSKLILGEGGPYVTLWDREKK